jgi:hypothetical protein
LSSVQEEHGMGLNRVVPDNGCCQGSLQELREPTELGRKVSAS